MPRRDPKLPARCAHCGSIPVLESGELAGIPGLITARIQRPKCPSQMNSNRAFCNKRSRGKETHKTMERTERTMTTTVELYHYCTVCGNELEAQIGMNKKVYNQGRIDVTPCKTCERNRAPEKKPVVMPVLRKKKCDEPDLEINAPDATIVPAPDATQPKRRGRPRKCPPPADPRIPAAAPIGNAPKRRGRPPKQKQADPSISAVPGKRKRGRPRKNPV